MTVVTDRVHREPTDRAAAEVQWLEELWARSPDASKPRPVRPHDEAGPRRWPFLLLLLAWPNFLVALYSIAPAESAAAPAWAEALGAGMVIALFFTLAGFLRAPFGYGTSGIAAGFGMALGLGCFAGGHTGLLPTFQLAGFTVLAGLSVFALTRSLRS